MATNYLWSTGQEESAIALSKNHVRLLFVLPWKSFNLKWSDCYNVYIWYHIILCIVYT